MLKGGIKTSLRTLSPLWPADINHRKSSEKYFPKQYISAAQTNIAAQKTEKSSHWIVYCLTSMDADAGPKIMWKSARVRYRCGQQRDFPTSTTDIIFLLNIPFVKQMGSHLALANDDRRQRLHNPVVCMPTEECSSIEQYDEDITYYVANVTRLTFMSNVSSRMRSYVKCV